jgi:hypothetical protein
MAAKTMAFWKKLAARNKAYHEGLLKAWELHDQQQACKPKSSPTDTTQVAKAPRSGGRKFKVLTKRCRLDEHELARRWRVPVSYLRKLRESGDGPKVTVTGTEVEYKLRDVKAHERVHELNGTSVRDGLRTHRA